MEDPKRNLITQHGLCAFIRIYALVLGLGLIAVWVKLGSPLHLPHSWATGQTVCTVSSGILELCNTTPTGATPHTCTHVKSQCMDCWSGVPPSSLSHHQEDHQPYSCPHNTHSDECPNRYSCCCTWRGEREKQVGASITPLALQT